MRGDRSGSIAGRNATEVGDPSSSSARLTKARVGDPLPECISSLSCIASPTIEDATSSVLLAVRSSAWRLLTKLSPLLEKPVLGALSNVLPEVYVAVPVSHVSGLLSIEIIDGSGSVELGCAGGRDLQGDASSRLPRAWGGRSSLVQARSGEEEAAGATPGNSREGGYCRDLQGRASSRLPRAWGTRSSLVQARSGEEEDASSTPGNWREDAARTNRRRWPTDGTLQSRSALLRLRTSCSVKPVNAGFRCPRLMASSHASTDSGCLGKRWRDEYRKVGGIEGPTQVQSLAPLFRLLRFIFLGHMKLAKVRIDALIETLSVRRFTELIYCAHRE